MTALQPPHHTHLRVTAPQTHTPPGSRPPVQTVPETGVFSVFAGRIVHLSTDLTWVSVTPPFLWGGHVCPNESACKWVCNTGQEDSSLGVLFIFSVENIAINQGHIIQIYAVSQWPSALHGQPEKGSERLRERLVSCSRFRSASRLKLTCLLEWLAGSACPRARGRREFLRPAVRSRGLTVCHERSFSRLTSGISPVDGVRSLRRSNTETWAPGSSRPPSVCARLFRLSQRSSQLWRHGEAGRVFPG